MKESRTSYRLITGSLTLFGGVQVFSLLVSLLRTKVVSVLVGVEGMGVLGLLASVFNLLAAFFGLGLETSSVRYISQQQGKDRKGELSRTIQVLRRLSLFIGLAAGLLVIGCSWPLASLTFGDVSHWPLFVWLGVALFFKVAVSAELALLQGLHRLKQLARANLFGSVVGLIVTLPVYYLYRLDGIAPAIALMTMASLVFALLFSRKLVPRHKRMPVREIFAEGREMLKLGISFGISGVATFAAAYLVQLYLNRTADMMVVGYYSAGSTFLTSYVGMLFTAMSADYFPRLSAVSDQSEKMKELLSQQSVIGLLVLLPVMLFFLAFGQEVIDLVYTPAFRPMMPMVAFGLFGMLFRAVSFPCGYVFLAKGDSAVFIRTALGFNLLFIALMVGGYELHGLFGVGISFALYYLFHLLGLLLILRLRYGWLPDPGVWVVFAVAVIIGLSALLATFIPDAPVRLVAGVLLLLVGSGYSAVQLNRRVGFSQLLASRFKKDRK